MSETGVAPRTARGPLQRAWAACRRPPTFEERVGTLALSGTIQALAGSWVYLTDPLAQTQWYFPLLNLLVAVYSIARAVALVLRRKGQGR